MRIMGHNIAGRARPRKTLGASACLTLALASLGGSLACGATPAAAQTPPALVLDTSLIIDGQTTTGTNPQSGAAARMQASLTLDGAAFGADGLTAMLDLAGFGGEGVSAKLGDLQGVSNIGAPPMVRPLNAWVQYSRGAFAAKAGIIDTNAEFDEQNVGAMFLNGSHGMGPDLGASGLNGGGASPYSALGVIGFWSNDTLGLKLRAGVFAGRPGDPDVPERWSWRVGADAGRLTMAEVDWTRPGWRVALGGWQHDTTLPRMDGTGDTETSRGGFATVEATLAGRPEGSEGPAGQRLDGWLRLGVADRVAAPVTRYVGGGLVWHGLLAAHPDDALGVSVAHARANRAGDPSLRPETVVELTFQHQLLPGVTLQPDAQYIIHPGNLADAPDSLVLGLRLIITH